MFGMQLNTMLFEKFTILFGKPKLISINMNDENFERFEIV